LQSASLLWVLDVLCKGVWGSSLVLCTQPCSSNMFAASRSRRPTLRDSVWSEKSRLRKTTWSGSLNVYLRVGQTQTIHLSSVFPHKYIYIQIWCKTSTKAYLTQLIETNACFVDLAPKPTPVWAWSNGQADLSHWQFGHRDSFELYRNIDNVHEQHNYRNVGEDNKSTTLLSN
jgi:hypothetical protein